MTEIQTENLSIEKIIAMVGEVRNNLIKDFMIDENAQNYFMERYQKSLSKIRLEFLKRDLGELLISPVDLAHYSSLIKEIRETNTANFPKGNNELFYKEVDVLFDKYAY